MSKKLTVEELKKLTLKELGNIDLKELEHLSFEELEQLTGIPPLEISEPEYCGAQFGFKLADSKNLSVNGEMVFNPLFNKEGLETENLDPKDSKE